LSYKLLCRSGIWWCYWAGAVKNRVFGEAPCSEPPPPRFCEYLNNQSSNQESDKGGDSLRCNISSANRVKKLNWFCIAGCEIIASGINCTGVICGFGFWFLVLKNVIGWSLWASVRDPLPTPQPPKIPPPPSSPRAVPPALSRWSPRGRSPREFSVGSSTGDSS